MVSLCTVGLIYSFILKIKLAVVVFPSPYYTWCSWNYMIKFRPITVVYSFNFIINIKLALFFQVLVTKGACTKKKCSKGVILLG